MFDRDRAHPAWVLFSSTANLAAETPLGSLPLEHLWLLTYFIYDGTIRLIFGYKVERDTTPISETPPSTAFPRLPSPAPAGVDHCANPCFLGIA